MWVGGSRNADDFVTFAITRYPKVCLKYYAGKYKFKKWGRVWMKIG